ncbi:MAG: lamin tail domain-containing protein, partial [Planctomycetales bacterium]|nr:lamin tail domain-containing protein [Planctomycetales bacterium]
MSRSAAANRRSRIEGLEPRHVLSVNVLITELMASNGGQLIDGDGASSDWLEIYNPTAETVDLAGWHLTDDAAQLDKWTFPDVAQAVLEPGSYLVVFASGQLSDGYVDAAGYLHASFQLAAEGDYLALSDGSLNVVHEFAPQYPPQRRDVSYGVVENVETLQLVGPSTLSRAITPADGSLDATSPGASPIWTLPGFDDGAWMTSVGGPGVGFDVGEEPPPDAPNGTLLPEGLVGADFTDPEEDGAYNGVIDAGGFPGSPAGEEPPKGLDNTVATKWLAFEPAGTYYEFHFDGGVQQIVNAYTISSANDVPNRDPYSWTLSGSNDGVSYTVIDSRDAQDFATRFETRLYEFQNSLPFTYYRFEFQTEYGVTASNFTGALQMSEIELFSSQAFNLDSLVDLDLESEWAVDRSSVYQRVEFDVADPATLGAMWLDMQYNDGFVAYLNG